MWRRLFSLCRSAHFAEIHTLVLGHHCISSRGLQIEILSGFCIERLIFQSCLFILTFPFLIDRRPVLWSVLQNCAILREITAYKSTLILQWLWLPSGLPYFKFKKLCLSLKLMKWYANLMLGSLQRSLDSSSGHTSVTALLCVCWNCQLWVIVSAQFPGIGNGQFCSDLNFRWVCPSILGSAFIKGLPILGFKKKKSTFPNRF